MNPAPAASRPLTIPDLARAVVPLLADAEAAGLTAPSTASFHAYKTAEPSAALLLPADTPDPSAAVQAWADRYGGQVETWTADISRRAYACTEFRSAGVDFEVTALVCDPNPSEFFGLIADADDE